MLSKQVQWNPDFSNPQVFDPPDNSNQKSFPSPQSNAVISRTFRFLKAIFISSLRSFTEVLCFVELLCLPVVLGSLELLCLLEVLW